MYNFDATVKDARMQTSTDWSRKSQKMAPNCIKMLLTPDYGETAKGKPEAPKAQTPYYCTGQGRASSFLTAPKGYNIPHPWTRKPLHSRAPVSTPKPKGWWGARCPTRPQGPGVTGACRQGSPYNKHFEAKPTANSELRARIRTLRMSGGANPDPDPDLSVWLTSSGQYLSACKGSSGSARITRSSGSGIRKSGSGFSTLPFLSFILFSGYFSCIFRKKPNRPQIPNFARGSGLCGCRAAQIRIRIRILVFD